MRKTSLTLLLLALSGFVYAENKVDIKFSGKQVENLIKRKICIVKENVLSISGDTADKNNPWRCVVFSLPYKSPANKKFKFSGEIKGEKIKGRFEVAIRLIDDENKSIKYETFTVTKDQDWKKFSKTFTAAANTEKMQFYIMARDMADDSVGSVRNLSIEQL